jgi:hypothetical protein
MKKNEKRSAIGYYRLRPSFKKKIKLHAKLNKISEAAALDMILRAFFYGEKDPT